ncbi:hypothetical protein EWM64_g10895 [Hericium alpestre]|uniref:AB hydrolase-1 domain-containing protein n=1 Tax=Hericium alpestre TaxID=135208 RepID=A0A4Y9ZGF6_9AGAM|nr:hypothetical protein EWM64_g10895 [Hericium alpestre]
MSESTGYIDFSYDGETFQTWYKTIGDLKSGVRPLVVLHGGPGMSHDYMLPHTELFSSKGIPVVFYDQIGIGKSTHLRDKPKEFWTVDLFVQELDNVLNNLGIAANFDFLGHSWGGMLAAEYAINRQPRGLQHLVLSSSLASVALWEASSNRLLDGEPEEMRETIRRHEREGTTDAQEYKGSLEVFASKYMCRVDPWPTELLASFAAQEEDPTVYATM